MKYLGSAWLSMQKPETLTELYSSLFRLAFHVQVEIHLEW